MIDRLIARVFATRNAAHLAHWAAKNGGSYAKHMALGDFYGQVIDKIDDIVETYQGTMGLVDVKFEAPRVDPLNILEHLKAEAAWIAEYRESIAAGSPSVLNLTDELHGIYAKTVYKLKYLA